MNVANPPKKIRSSSPKPPKNQVNKFHQRLAQLTAYQATQMLGKDGNKLLSVGGAKDIDPYKHVRLDSDLLRISLPQPSGDKVNVTITLQSARDKQLQINCSLHNKM